MTGVLSMSELNNASQALDLGVENGELPGSPGKLLRAAREASGVHIAALAGSLKVSVSKLEALERDDFSGLPDAVFARALASSICRALGLDPAPVLKLMPKNEAPNFSTTSTSINASFKDSSRKMGRNSFLEHAMRPVSLAVMGLLLGVLALLFVPFGSEAPAIADEGAQIDLDTSEQETIAAPMPQRATSDTVPVSESDAEKIAAPMNAVATSIPPELAGTSPEAGMLAASADLLEFRSLGESWVQVRDATKTVVFERTLIKGETVSVTGVLPLMVVVGRADATEVLIRGKVFALAGVAKENVARFEVKQ